jgi:hypothetical protein
MGADPPEMPGRFSRCGESYSNFSAAAGRPKSLGSADRCRRSDENLTVGAIREYEQAKEMSE